MKVIVAGGRDFNNYSLMCEKLDHFFSETDKTKLVMVNGDGPGLWSKEDNKYIAEGADQLAKKYARERNIPVELYPPDWKGLGRAAGPIRNEQMAKVANALVAFDTGGRGTANMISLAKQYGLSIRIVPSAIIK